MRRIFCLLSVLSLPLLVSCGEPASEEPTPNNSGVSCSDGERFNPIQDRCEPIPVADMGAGPDQSVPPDDMDAVRDMVTQPDQDEEPDAGPDMTVEPDMTAAPDMAVELDMVVEPDMSMPVDMGGNATTATLRGTVTRSTQPQNGGVGGLYVAIFERNPLTDMANPGLVGRTLIENADMSAPGASYTYEIPNIPPRAGAYYITAFLDDNNTVDVNNPDTAGPDRGDLVSLNGFSFPTVTVSEPGEKTFDIDLNLAMPF